MDLGDKAAFVTVSAGLTQYYDRVFSTESLLEENVTRLSDYPLYAALFGGGAEARSGAEAPRLLFAQRRETVFLPELGRGRLRPVKRVRFLKQDGDDPVLDAVNPRRVVTAHHLTLLDCVDGARSSAEIAAEARRRGVPRWWLARFGAPFLEELSVQGVLGPAGQPAAA